MSEPHLPTENASPPDAPGFGVVTSPYSALQRVFVGPDGIRAMWRLLAYLLMAAIIAFGLLFILQPWEAHGAAILWLTATQEGFLVIAVIVPTIIMSRVEKRPFSVYGLPPRAAFGKLFWTGTVWGLLAITLLLSMMRAFHGFYFGHLALHGIRILKFAVFWGVFFLVVGLFEEFLLRGYTQFTLTRTIGFWPAAVILSMAFGAMHLGNSGEAWVGLLSAGLIGFFFCLTLRRTGNLWFAVGFHQAFDWGETFLYSVPNSGTTAPGHLLNPSLQGPVWLTGGSVGPEGSVFVFVMIAILWIVFDRIYPDVKYPVESHAAVTPESPVASSPLGIAG